MLIAALALITASLFSGAAIYINAVEQPARLTLSDRAALVEWAQSYRRAAPMQAGLAVIAALFGFWQGVQAEDWRWLVGGILMLGNWLYTLLVIKPVNDRLHSAGPDKASDQTRRMIESWGRLHAGRSALGLAATLLFLWGLVA